ncbi:MFS transporter, partial [Enterococcus faecium]
ELQGDGKAMFNTLHQFSGAVPTSLVAVIINYVQHLSSHKYQVSTRLGSKAALRVLLLLLLVSFARFAYYLFFAKKE